jgi:hypothetical protein
MRPFHLIISLIYTALILQSYSQEWIPKDAEVCYKSVVEDGFLPDSNYKLKLKVTKEQFNAIVTKIGAKKHKEDSKYTDDIIWLRWDIKPIDSFENIKKQQKKKESWDPDDSITNTYVVQSGDTWQLLKYEHGFLYYQYTNH